MAVSGSKEFDVKATPAEVMAVVAAVEELPNRSKAHRSAEAETRYDDGRPKRVRAKVSTAGFSDEEVTDYTWDDDHKVTWTLVSSGVQSKQVGSYTLTPTDNGTHVLFELEIDVKVPMPGFLLKKVLGGALTSGSKDFAKYVENRPKS
ncbi:SRPBCC family protein [Skermania sp. ID1734]|uniref:SRPBCC family protein n=1 Tax=Skermania sp. ID1734 TaxID=2597516 RepID=UPI00117D4220|nr:SRPBCC family protein [Skermania sp. ID1734]TSD96089.1 SRPBCC family protein [Skermania sp. ID1734]